MRLERVAPHLLLKLAVAVLPCIYACTDHHSTQPDSGNLQSTDTNVAVDVAADQPTQDTADVSHEPACPDPTASGWQACDGALFDARGRRIQLRGVNVSQARKLPPYEGGMSDADLAAMARLGLNHVRLITSWAAVMPEEGRIDSTYVSRLVDEVRRAAEHGILVIVDSHQDLYGEAIATDAGPLGNGAPAWACPEEIASQFVERRDPWFLNYLHPAVQGCFDHLLGSPALQDAFGRAWAAVAEAVGNEPNVVGYDLWNEPFSGTHDVETWEVEQLMPVYEVLAAAILEVDPEALVVIEPGNQKNLFGTSALPPPPFPRAVYAPHLYHPAMEAGDPWPGDIDFFADRLDTDLDEAAALGDLPLYIGEWGTPGGHDNDPEFVRALVDLLDAAAVSWAIWQWGPGTRGYSLVDFDLAFHDHALELARPYPERLAGEVHHLAFDAASRTFELRFQPGEGDAPPSVVVIPPARYPQGGDIAAVNATVARSSLAGRIEVTPIDPSLEVEIAVRPDR